MSKQYSKQSPLSVQVYSTGLLQKIGLFTSAIGLIFLLIVFVDKDIHSSGLWLAIILAAIFGGIVLYAVTTYLKMPAGIKNNAVYFNSLTARKSWAWFIGVVLTSFYILLYWFPHQLGLGSNGNTNTGIVALFDPLSMFMKNTPASQWFVYGTFYTLAILAFGIKFILKYRHDRYQVIRTLSVMFFQLIFAFLIPEILQGLNTERAYFTMDLKNFWPLNYYFFESWHLNNMLSEGGLGMFFLFWGIIGSFIVVPILTYFFGKRWYCSWVCGCGGLAETAGDSFRHLSDNSLRAWRIERVLIHSILVFITIVTFAVLYGFFFHKSSFLGLDIYSVFSKPYGFIIGAAFSGVIGVGFYPILGNRVWCRFGCPLAAYMGIIQRFKSRFRITTNGGQCISCGNCSTYCEMGIDVRAYAQKGQNIVRASCVGCGICSAVCPRGVLKLENGSLKNRIKKEDSIFIN